MKSIKRFSAILLLAMIMALVLVPVSAFAAETDAGAIAHDAHIDTTGDGLCDIEGCDVKLPCTDHKDVDGDKKCDIDGCDECIEHNDGDDEDNLCDNGCGTVVCTEHVDDNKDEVCDTVDCGAHVQIKNTIGTDKWLDNLLESLKIVGIGILGIFLVTGIIIAVVYLLNKFTNAEKKPNTEE